MWTQGSLGKTWRDALGASPVLAWAPCTVPGTHATFSNPQTERACSGMQPTEVTLPSFWLPLYPVARCRATM